MLSHRSFQLDCRPLQPQKAIQAASHGSRRTASRQNLLCSAAAEQGPAQQVDRRQLLVGALLVAPQLLPGQSSAAAAVEGPAAVAGGLSQPFLSSEGFAFQYPSDWVVAFDRSGSVRGNGAVMVAGNFRTFDTVSVFRTEVPAADVARGLTQELGLRLAVEPQEKEASTMRFQVLSSQVAAGEGCDSFNYEYQIETCRGEIIEGVGGRIQCLGPQGQDLQVLRRHHMGRALLINNFLYMLNASAPEDRWAELEPTMAAVVASFRC